MIMKQEFLKYFAVGISSMLLDIASLSFFVRVLDVYSVTAVAINQIIVITVSFLLNYKWSFQSGERKRDALPRYVAVYGLNYVIAIVAMYVFSDRLGIMAELVRIVNIALSVSWNFLLYRLWVFRSHKTSNDEQPAVQSIDS